MSAGAGETFHNRVDALETSGDLDLEVSSQIEGV